MNKRNRLILFAIPFVWIASFICTTQGQVAYTLAPSPELTIIGKSNIRTWKMTSNFASGQGMFLMDVDMLRGIQNLDIEMQSESLTSGTKGLDKHAYESLQTGQHPSVFFHLKEINGRGEDRQAKGEFTIAGVTKEVQFPVKVKQIGSAVTFQGEIPIKFSDFKLVTPTNFMGLVKTYDDARILFNTTFQPTN